MVVIHNEGLYPEGVSYDEQEDFFYISSVARGEVWRVNQKGESELFFRNDDFASTVGIQVDKKGNRLLVCVADPGVGENSKDKSRGKLAGLAIYDLKSKRQLAYYDLPPSTSQSSHFANDVTTDEKGNIYVSDSFSPVIYKIDIQGKVTTFANSRLWDVPSGKFGLNGIVYHSGGYLIVSHYDSGKLYKVDTSHPQNINEIDLIQQNDKWRITGLDGLLLLNNETLVAVNNDPSGSLYGNAVYRLSSNDNWSSASVDAAMPTSNTYPTTLTSTGKDVYVLHAKLLELFTGNKFPEKTFEIEKVLFSNLN